MKLLDLVAGTELEPDAHIHLLTSICLDLFDFLQL